MELGGDPCVTVPPCLQSAPVGAEPEQCWPGSARATRASELQPVAVRVRGTERTGQLIGSGARCDSEQEACSEVAKQVHWRGLTFDMSGGPKGAKRPLARPLDGGVR